MATRALSYDEMADEQTAALKTRVCELEHELKTLWEGVVKLLDFDIDDWTEPDGTAKLLFTREQVAQLKTLQTSFGRVN